MEPTSRPYRSPKRADQARRTRERVLFAATERFLVYGYAGTSLSAVAADAGVSLATVELAFGTKAALLKAAIDSATAGDHEPVAMLQRPFARRAAETQSARDFLAIFSEALAGSAARAAGLAAAAFEAAPRAPEVARVAASLAAQREAMSAWLVDGLWERSAPRAGVTRQAAVDTVWALMDPVLFGRLVRDRGWTAEQFGRWFDDTIARLLLP
ncbi:MAG TPA: helix-turn-helix domain-containing protein [Propionibacteriaceae bacterium]